MRSQILMPLRSNAAWFGSPEARAGLERQIKVNLMLYDRVIFQNGRWHMTAGTDGQGMEHIWWKDQAPMGRTRIPYYGDSGPFSIHVGETCVLHSIAETSYEVDFLPIMRDAGILDTACYDWLNDEVKLSGEADEALSRSAEALVRKCADVLPKNAYVQWSLAKGLLKDAFTAQHLNLPVSVDYQVAPVVYELQRALILTHKPELRLQFVDRWIRLKLPDFGEWSWDTVLDVRESASGLAFREMVARVCNGVTDAVRNGASEGDIENLMALGFEQELIREVQKRQPTRGATALGLLLNLLPYGSILSVGKDLYALANEGES